MCTIKRVSRVLGTQEDHYLASYRIAMPLAHRNELANSIEYQ